MTDINSFKSLGKKEEPNDDLELDTDSTCDKCGEITDKLFCSRDGKTLTKICPEKHVTKTNGNFEWMLDIYG